MKKRIVSLLLVLLMAFSILPVQLFATSDASAVSVRCYNEATGTYESARTVSLPFGGEVSLSAGLPGGIAGLYQWQIKAGQTWVDIQDGTTAELRVSYGLIKSLLQGGSVQLRCTASVGTEEYSSDPVTVTVAAAQTAAVTAAEDPVAPAPLPAPVAENQAVTDTPAAEPAPEMPEEPASEEEPVADDAEQPTTEETTATEDTPAADEPADERTTVELEVEAPVLYEAAASDVAIYTVTIEYVYAEDSKFAGQRVALPYIAEIAEGNGLQTTVYSPSCVGYTPDQASITLDMETVTANASYTVEYSPAEVSYTVRHYQQNVGDDEYTWVDTTLATGYTEALTRDDAAKTYTGFTALSHYHEEIAANSSTMIDIYYDRNYYLLSFELDGGFGVEPIYARYGSGVYVQTPYKPGYTFTGWDRAVPAVMPAANGTYTAQWISNDDIPFTVVYWLEDPNNPGTYDFWTSVEKTGTAGDTVQGEDYKTLPSGVSDELVRYSYYDHADKDIAIKGDGTTVVNVYYDRNEYTLKFYYAARTTSSGSEVYKIFGGSSYSFGAANDNSYNGDEMELLNGIYNNSATQWGTITAAPTLNTNGLGRNYAQGYDTKNGVDYLYISFSAKYGADISGLWPCNVFNEATRTSISNNTNGWNGTAAYVSAWNGEHHVYYSQHNSNQTIKGNYNELDYQLLFDSQYTDSSTVAYLCFWENGSGNVGWNVPKLFVYNIYVPLLEGMSTDGLTLKSYYGVTYYLLASYDTVDNSTHEEQTPPAINGYRYQNYNHSDITNPDTSKYVKATDVDFYYAREQYQLTFVNGSAETSSDVIFGTDISGKAPANLTYHDPALQDLYAFNGWYTTPDAIPGTEFTLDGATMPDNALTLYANWAPITRSVAIYPTEADALAQTNQIGQTLQVSNDTRVPEDDHPETPTNGDETFIGWFYRDTNGEEQAFSFSTMTISHDMLIYAKWRSNVMKQVEVHYVVEDANGVQTPIADSETLMLRVGQTRTFEAKTGLNLYEAYRTGCFPTTTSHSITPTSDQDSFSYTFVYEQYEAVPYNVRFMVQEEDDTLRPAYKEVNGKAVFMADYDTSAQEYVETHDDNDKAIVTELYIPDALADATWVLPEGYIPNALKMQRVIVPGENNAYNDANTIVFVYRYAPDEKVGLYTVNHYIQSTSDAAQFELHSYKEYTGTVGDTAAVSPISIPGYAYSHDITEQKLPDTNTLTTADGTDTMTGSILSDDSLVLDFYYAVNDYPYQIMYLEQDTNRILAPARTTDENGDQLTGDYGAKVTAEAVDIDGYNVDAARKSIYIHQEAANPDGSYTASINTIVFYYTRKSADLIITKAVGLDEEQAKDEDIIGLPDSVRNQDFTFTVTSKQGFHKSVYDYTVTDAQGNEVRTGKVTATTFTMDSVTLRPGQKLRIHDLAMGDYTVTETYAVGFRTSVNGEVKLAEDVTLDTADQTVTVDFVNTYPFYTGDLVILKELTGLETGEPTAAAYPVRITLQPDDATRQLDRVITWTDADGSSKTYTVPKLADSTVRTFTIDVNVPAGEEVKLAGVPAGTFTAEELSQHSGSDITDSYNVAYKVAVHQNDVTHFISGSEVSSQIHGGHPTAVTFRNTAKQGDITISKTVTQEYVNDNWQSDTFTFRMTGTTDLPDTTESQVYAVTVGEADAPNATATVTNGVVTVQMNNGKDLAIDVEKTEETDAWTETLTVSGLPAGTYAVTETVSDAYTSDPASGVISGLAVGDTASFTNTYKRTTGSLQVGKEIVIVTQGTIIDTDQPFTFEVDLKDTNLQGSYVCQVYDSKGTNSDNDDTIVPGAPTSLTANGNGTLSFNLCHDQYILIQALPVGEYLVKELALEGYDSSFGEVSDGNQYSVDPAAVTTGETTALHCQNAYPVYYSNLHVSKEVVTPDTHSDADRAPEDDSFTFTVTMWDYSDKIDLSNGVTAHFYDSPIDTTAETRTLYVTNDTLTFQLKDGQWVDLNLPACFYRIEETDLTSTVNSDGGLEDHYSVSYQVGDTVGTADATYALVSGEVEEVVFTNTYKRHYGDLTIYTICADSSQSFVFDVSAQDTALGDIQMEVVLVGTDSVTVKDLPIGTYTVTEQGSWSWRESEVGSRQAVLVTEDASVTFDFGQVDRTQWLSGYSYNLKYRKGGN